MQYPDPNPHDHREPRLQDDDQLWTSCPIGSSWRTWDFLSIPKRRLAGDARERSDELQRLVRRADLRELHPEWVIAADDPLRTHTGDGSPMGRYPHCSHVHTELEIDGVRVHVDWVTRNSYGPGRSMTEAHIFVDGEREGHAFHGGCSLGFGSNSFPAVARVAPGRVLVIDDCGKNVVLFEERGRRYYRADAKVQRPRVRLCGLAI